MAGTTWSSEQSWAVFGCHRESQQQQSINATFDFYQQWPAETDMSTTAARQMYSMLSLVFVPSPALHCFTAAVDPVAHQCTLEHRCIDPAIPCNSASLIHYAGRHWKKTFNRQACRDQALFPCRFRFRVTAVFASHLHSVYRIQRLLLGSAMGRPGSYGRRATSHRCSCVISDRREILSERAARCGQVYVTVGLLIM